MNENVVRYISKDGSVVAYGIDSTEIVGKAERIHKTSAVVTAALGRLLTAASLMGISLKSEKASVTLRIKGNGPIGSIVAVSDAAGNVRGYAENKYVEIPLSKRGKLDVGTAVGKDGTLTVIKDLGLKEPYVGQIKLVSGEIAEDVTSYYGISEQIPTVCALGVLVNPDLSVKCSGGFIIQLLPGSGEKEISQIENNLKDIPVVTTMMESGCTPDDICKRILEGFDPQVLDGYSCAYNCYCSRSKVEKALISLGRAELEEMIEQGQDIEVGCDFCNKQYCFTTDELKKLF